MIGLSKGRKCDQPLFYQLRKHLSTYPQYLLGLSASGSVELNSQESHCFYFLPVPPFLFLPEMQDSRLTKSHAGRPQKRRQKQ